MCFVVFALCVFAGVSLLYVRVIMCVVSCVVFARVLFGCLSMCGVCVLLRCAYSHNLVYVIVVGRLSKFCMCILKLYE